MDAVSGLPPMLPSQMSEILDAEAATTDLGSADGGFISLAEALSPQEQLQLASLQSAEAGVGMLSPGGSSSALDSPAAYLDLSVAAQEQLMQQQASAGLGISSAPAAPAVPAVPAAPSAFDPTTDPANPFYGAAPTGSWYADDPVDPSWATDPANPDFYA